MVVLPVAATRLVAAEVGLGICFEPRVAARALEAKRSTSVTGRDTLSGRDVVAADDAGRRGLVA